MGETGGPPLLKLVASCRRLSPPWAWLFHPERCCLLSPAPVTQPLLGHIQAAWSHLKDNLI